MVWSGSERKWELWFQQLLEYKEPQCDCNVPLRFSPNPQLGYWVMKQWLPRNKLCKECKDRLNLIEFIWDGRLVDWDTCFE
jgi:hypothetical protein